MPILKSSKKALRRDRRRAVINKKIRNNLKEVLKKARKSPNLKNLSSASCFLDRAAKKKIIHKNKADRLKSRLSKLLAKTKKK
ncbi:MAG: 30S ribosomal protein S20 [Candidatus Shapirobacteria bacterium]|nr:30S ribosomal protein S20 [Candidatus Shapirobacteria bacterium]